MKIGIKQTAFCVVVCMGFVTALLSGCNNLNRSPKSAEKQLISFAFKKNSNPWLNADIVGTIDEASHTVSMTVPESAYKYEDSAKKGNRQFKASFTVSPKAKLYKGSAEQTSNAMEDLFIQNKEYKVVAEDGTSKTYTVRIKIDYAMPTVPSGDAEQIKKLYGTYRGMLHFDNHDYTMWVVFDEEKSISYSQPMSAIYTNMQWEKISANKWTCKTYHKKDFKRTTVSNTATFTIGADGKITCKIVVAPMNNAETIKPLEKGADYVFSPDDGKGFKMPTEY